MFVAFHIAKGKKNMFRSGLLAFALLAATTVAKAAPGPYDGVYLGPATGAGGGQCITFKMLLRVKEGEVSAKYTESLTFEGSVRPDGSIDIPFRARTLVGKIAAGTFVGRVESPQCRYNLELTKQ